LRKTLSALACCLVLFGCGSDGGGTGGTPTPTPTPSQTPTPTPSPTPTPTSVVYTAEVGSAVVGRVYFDLNKDGNFTDNEYQITDLSGHTSGGLAPAQAQYALSSRGHDRQTAFNYAFRAPAGATTVSPVTTLLRSIDDDTVANNTGLGIAARDLATFGAVAAMSSSDTTVAAKGRRVTAFNLKLLAFARSHDLVFFPDRYSNDGFSPDTLAPLVDQFVSGRVDLNDAASILAIINKEPWAANASADRRAAIAQTIAHYGAAVDAYLTAPQKAADIEYGYRLAIIPIIADQLDASVPLAAVKTTDEMISIFSQFADAVPPALEPESYDIPGSPNSMVAVYDTLKLGPPSTTPTLFDWECATPDNSAITCNDFYQGAFIRNAEFRVTAVRVPAKFAPQIEASLSPDPRYISLRRLAPRTSSEIPWIEYDVTLLGYGNTATGRIYLP